MGLNTLYSLTLYSEGKHSLICYIYLCLFVHLEFVFSFTSFLAFSALMKGL